MVKCNDCNNEMHGSESCTKNTLIIQGKEYERNTEIFDTGEVCHDCGIVNKKGNIHHSGCDMEQCPRCEGQLISCDCEVQHTILIKKEPEQQLLKAVISDIIDTKKLICGCDLCPSCEHMDKLIERWDR